MGYRYSRWNGAQGCGEIGADEVLDALSGDLAAHGDVASTVQRAVNSGIDGENGVSLAGLDGLRTELQRVRQELLEQYGLQTMLGDIESRLSSIVERERDAIDQRLNCSACGQEGDDGMTSVMQSVARRSGEALHDIPTGSVAALSRLAGYEFLDQRAQAEFGEVLELVQQRVLGSNVRGIEQTLEESTAERVGTMSAAVRALNELIEHADGNGHMAFAQFSHEYGHLFPPARSLGELLEALVEQAGRTEAVLENLDAVRRHGLEEGMKSVIGSGGLREELSRLAVNLDSTQLHSGSVAEYPFSGAERVSFDEMIEVMRRLQEMDQVEHSFEAMAAGESCQLDFEAIERTLGAWARSTAEQLAGLQTVLEGAGYVEVTESGPRLTARGARRVGQRVLDEIFARLRYARLGGHPGSTPGPGPGSSDETKRYEFGDRLTIDVHGTLMNGLRREAGRLPLHLHASDFEVFQSEESAGAATVLALDMSRSMPLRGCFDAARSVGLALQTLIHTQFPRDRLYVVGFSDLAREITPSHLHSAEPTRSVHGTNMQHAFAVARRLLGKHREGNRQIILITDGEPTAHVGADGLEVGYPPSTATVIATLREVQRCTREGIVINTFMLARTHYLLDFVSKMTEMNNGRAFFVTPDRLGEYIVLDYVRSKGAMRRL
jgi:uncharacterized protein with von Willebrand factor type A (vWA) domain